MIILLTFYRGGCFIIHPEKQPRDKPYNRTLYIFFTQENPAIWIVLSGRGIVTNQELCCFAAAAVEKRADRIHRRCSGQHTSEGHAVRTACSLPINKKLEILRWGGWVPFDFYQGKSIIENRFSFPFNFPL